MLQAQGKHGNAEEMYWRALEGKEKALGADQPDTPASTVAGMRPTDIAIERLRSARGYLELKVGLANTWILGETVRSAKYAVRREPH